MIIVNYALEITLWKNSNSHSGFCKEKKGPPSVPGARLVEGLPRGFRKML